MLKSWIFPQKINHKTFIANLFYFFYIHFLEFAYQMTWPHLTKMQRGSRQVYFNCPNRAFSNHYSPTQVFGS